MYDGNGKEEEEEGKTPIAWEKGVHVNASQCPRERRCNDRRALVLAIVKKYGCPASRLPVFLSLSFIFDLNSDNR